MYQLLKFKPVGSSPTRIHGIGLSPIMNAKVNKMREVKEAQDHCKWTKMANKVIVKQQSPIEISRRRRRLTNLTKKMLTEQPKT